MLSTIRLGCPPKALALEVRATCWSLEIEKHTTVTGGRQAETTLQINAFAKPKTSTVPLEI